MIIDLTHLQMLLGLAAKCAEAEGRPTRFCNRLEYGIIGLL